MHRSFIGVDVCQDYLDVHVRPASLRQRFANTAAGIVDLLAWVRPHAAERILFESTGPSQNAAVGALLAEGLPAVVVEGSQPDQGRDPLPAVLTQLRQVGEQGA